MRNRLWCLAGALFLWAPRYGCHKPTPEEDYAQAKQCYVVLDTFLKSVPAAHFGQTRLDRGAVESASDDLLGGTWDIGKGLGMSVDAVSWDIQSARATYSKRRGRSPGELRKDADDCLRDYYGDPND